VWAVDPEDNSLQSVADYLSGFVEDFLTHSGLSCRFRIPVSLPVVLLDGQVRHGLVMAVKETLNNVVKHAEATEVEFSLAVNDGTLQIVVADNGKGFDLNSGRDGHGLKNLPARLTKAGGTCQVESAVRRGTTVTIRLPLPARAQVAQETTDL
jgi:signal transduction histidine kinase